MSLLLTARSLLHARWSPSSTSSINGQVALQDMDCSPEGPEGVEREDAREAAALVPAEGLTHRPGHHGAPPPAESYAVRKRKLVDRWAGLCALAARGGCKTILNISSYDISDMLVVKDAGAADGEDDIKGSWIPIAKYYCQYKMALADVNISDKTVDVWTPSVMPTSTSMFEAYFDDLVGRFGDRAYAEYELHHMKVTWNMHGGVFSRGRITGESTLLFRLQDVGTKASSFKASVAAFVKCGAKEAARTCVGGRGSSEKASTAS